MASVVIRIDGRFSGPAGSGNGGYVAGRLAGLTGGEAEVTLHAPVPVDRPLSFVPESEGTVRLELPDGTVVARARRHRLELAAPVAPTMEEACRGEAAFPRFEEHPLPRCFVCGPERSDGLRIFPGLVPGREPLVAAPWTPDGSLPVAGAGVAPEIVWAALDCAGAFAVNEPPKGLALLGRFAARVSRRPSIDEPCIVGGWPLGESGRKLEAGTALWSGEGELLGIARATWILLDPEKAESVAA